MTPDPNILRMTPDQVERLVLLADEAAQLAESALKALRHGLRNHHPDSPAVTNADTLRRRMTDVCACYSMLTDHRDTGTVLKDEVARSKAVKLTATYHQKPPQGYTPDDFR